LSDKLIVLDTNIVSELERPSASVAVRSWYGLQDGQELYLTSTTVAELAFGAQRIVLRNNSTRYQRALDALLTEAFLGKILEFGKLAALENGKIRADREAAGRPIALNDAQIAAICLVHGATLATRNVRDFDGLGLKLVNPFEA
jgi:toxin FitB